MDLAPCRWQVAGFHRAHSLHRLSKYDCVAVFVGMPRALADKESAQQHDQSRHEIAQYDGGRRLTMGIPSTGRSSSRSHSRRGKRYRYEYKKPQILNSDHPFLALRPAIHPGREALKSRFVYISGSPAA